MLLSKEQEFQELLAHQLILYKMQDSGKQQTGQVKGTTTDPAQVKVINHPYREVIHTFGIREEQLKEFEKGIRIPLYLNFSIFLLSLAGSLIGSMIPSFTNSETTSVPLWIKIAFYSGIASLVIGIFLMSIWLYINKRIRSLADDIRKLPPEGTPAE